MTSYGITGKVGALILKNLLNKEKSIMDSKISHMKWHVVITNGVENQRFDREIKTGAERTWASNL